MVRRRRKKKAGFVDVVIRSSWKEVLFYASFILFCQFLIVPVLNNPILNKLNASFTPFGLVVIGILILTSIAKFFMRKKPVQVKLEQNTETPFAITTLSETLQRPTSWSLKVIQEVEWKRFEDLAAAYYLEKGILARATSLGADGGIDIKLYQDNTNNPTSLIQCKAWNSKQIGVKEVREFLGVLTDEKISKGFFMSTGKFTEDAKRIAKSNKINLITGEMFLSMILRLNEASQRKLLKLATAGDYKTPSCSACGIKMVKRSSKRGEFWGCKNYPRCRQKLFIKKSI